MLLWKTRQKTYFEYSWSIDSIDSCNSPYVINVCDYNDWHRNDWTFQKYILSLIVWQNSHKPVVLSGHLWAYSLWKMAHVNISLLKGGFVNSYIFCELRICLSCGQQGRRAFFSLHLHVYKCAAWVWWANESSVAVDVLPLKLKVHLVLVVVVQPPSSAHLNQCSVLKLRHWFKQLLLVRHFPSRPLSFND